MPSFKTPAPPPSLPKDDDESKLVRSTKESAAMRRLGKVLEEKKRLNSTINNHSKRLHNLSKSFRRQTLQENNRNLARAVQKGKERIRAAEAQIVHLNREKQELWDEICRLRQIVGKGDVELNTLVEDRVEKRLTEIRQAASQLMELSGSVVNLCLADRLSLTGRESTGMDYSDVNAISRPSSIGNPTVVLTSAGVDKASTAPDLSLITESSFLDTHMLPPFQFMDDPRRLAAVSESEEERRSRSRSSTRSRRSGIVSRPSFGERQRSRSRSSQSVAIAESTESRKIQNTENTDTTDSTDGPQPSTEITETTGKFDHEKDGQIENEPENAEKKQNSEDARPPPRISVENAEDSQCDISVSEILKQRFPGGDKIARTPPSRRTSSNPSSKTVTPRSSDNTPRCETFVIPLGSPSSAPKVVPTFTPTGPVQSPKILKKSTNETFSFIPLENEKPKSDPKSKTGTSRVVKVKKDAKPKKGAKTKPEVEVTKEKSGESENVQEDGRRRRTYSLGSSENLNFEKADENLAEKPNLNGTFEKEKPDVLPVAMEAVVAMETTTDDEAMEAVAKEAESVVAAMKVPEIVADNLDDSLGVLDSTVLDALDMELTEVIPHSIRLDDSGKIDPKKVDPPAAEPNESPVPKDKGLKRPRQISPQEQTKKVVPEKQRKRNPSQRGKKKDPHVEEENTSSQDSDGVLIEKEVEEKVEKQTKRVEKESKKSRTKSKSSKDEVEELNESSSSSADESAVTFHYFRRKPGKLNFVVGRKDQNGRPLDPVAMMKKSRSKKKVVHDDKKGTDGNSSDQAEEKSPYEFSQEPEIPPVENVRKSKSGSVSEKIGKKTETSDDSKEQEKPVFKIPVARSRTKTKSTKQEPAVEPVKTSRSRRTTVVKTYREDSGDEGTPDKGKKVVPPEIDPEESAGKRRQTKIIRRVSAVPKPDPVVTHDVEYDDASVHVINDTITYDVTMNDDVAENGSMRKELKTYSSRKETPHVIRPKHNPEIRRQTQVITKPEIPQVLPSTEVTLPEPETMPFDAFVQEVEPPEPEMAEPDDEMTLDLTKLIKSVNREKAARAQPVEPVDDEMTLDLTKLLKHIDREKMLRDAKPVTSSALPAVTSSLPVVTSQPESSQSENEKLQQGEGQKVKSKIARRKDTKRATRSIDSPDPILTAATPSGSGRIPSDVDSPDLQKLTEGLMMDDDVTPARRSQRSSRPSESVLQPRDQNSTVKKSSRKTKEKKESESKRESKKGRERESVRESGVVEFLSDDEFQTENDPDRLSGTASPKRPRRGQSKSYKEPSLNIKMRRETEPVGWKKTKKKSKGSSKGTPAPAP